MNDIEGFVLNGGMSSRMGTPKGALRIGELTLAEYAADALLAVCDHVYAVGGEPTLDAIETVPDVAWGEKRSKGVRSSVCVQRCFIVRQNMRRSSLATCRS